MGFLPWGKQEFWKCAFWERREVGGGRKKEKKKKKELLQKWDDPPTMVAWSGYRPAFTCLHQLVGASFFSLTQFNIIMGSALSLSLSLFLPLFFFSRF